MINRARRRYTDNRSEVNFKLLKLIRKEYETINKCKAVHRKKIVADLKEKESNDPKAFWEIINKNTKHVNKGNVTVRFTHPGQAKQSNTKIKSE